MEPVVSMKQFARLDRTGISIQALFIWLRFFLPISVSISKIRCVQPSPRTPGASTNQHRERVTDTFPKRQTEAMFPSRFRIK